MFLITEIRGQNRFRIIFGLKQHQNDIKRIRIKHVGK